MDWQTILLSVIGIILTALVSWGAERLIALINSKLANTKYAQYLTAAIDVVARAVKTTYQTYVEVLKDKNMFTTDAQKEALETAKNITLVQLSQDMKKFVEENFGNLEDWIYSTIEAVLYDLKNQSVDGGELAF